MSVTVLIGVMLLGGSFLIYMIHIPIDKGFQTAVFLVILLLAGTLFTSSVFADIGDNKKAIASLTLPASHFEKYLVAWLYSFVLFLVVYTTIFYATTLIAVNIQHFPGHPAEVFNVFDRHVAETYLLYAFFHSIAFFGAIFFEKLHFIKTAFIFFILIAIAIFLNKIVIGALLGRETGVPVPFGSVRFLDNGRITDININNMPDPYVAYLITVLALIFWVAAYYRLKEKQV
jgi:hypothetical protein